VRLDLKQPARLFSVGMLSPA